LIPIVFFSGLSADALNFNIHQYFGNLISLDCSIKEIQQDVLQKGVCEYLDSAWHGDLVTLNGDLRLKYNIVNIPFEQYLSRVYEDAFKVCSGNVNFFDNYVVSSQSGPYGASTSGQQQIKMFKSYVGVDILDEETKIFSYGDSSASYSQAVSQAPFDPSDVAYKMTAPDKLVFNSAFDSSLPLVRDCFKAAFKNDSAISQEEERSCRYISSYELPKDEIQKTKLQKKAVKSKLGDELIFLLDDSIFREKKMIAAVYNKCLANSHPSECIKNELYENEKIEKEIAARKKNIEIGYAYKKKLMDALELDKNRVNYLGGKSAEYFPKQIRRKYASLVSQKTSFEEFEKSVLRNQSLRDKEYVDLFYDKMKKVAEPYIYAQSYTNMETLLSTTAKK